MFPLVTRSLQSHPGQFDKIKIDGLAVRARMKRLFPNPEVQQVPHRPRYIIQPGEHAKETVPSKHPGLYLGVFDKVVSPEGQNAILSLWDQVKAAGAKFPFSDLNRSSSPALHLGVWSLSNPSPIITSDTRNQSPAAIKAIRHFLQAIAKLIAPKLKMLLRHYAPEVWERQQRWDPAAHC